MIHIKDVESEEVFPSWANAMKIPMQLKHQIPLIGVHVYLI